MFKSPLVLLGERYGVDVNGNQRKMYDVFCENSNNFFSMTDGSEACVPLGSKTPYANLYRERLINVSFPFVGCIVEVDGEQLFVKEFIRGNPAVGIGNPARHDRYIVINTSKDEFQLNCSDVDRVVMGKKPWWDETSNMFSFVNGIK